MLFGECGPGHMAPHTAEVGVTCGYQVPGSNRSGKGALISVFLKGFCFRNLKLKWGLGLSGDCVAGWQEPNNSPPPQPGRASIRIVPNKLV